MLVLFIYVASIVNSVKSLFDLAPVIIFSAITMGLVSVLISHLDGFPQDLYTKSDVFKLCKRICLTATVIFFINPLVPDEKAIYRIGAAYLAEKAYDNIIDTPEFHKAREFINLKLDSEIKELKTEKKVTEPEVSVKTASDVKAASEPSK